MRERRGRMATVMLAIMLAALFVPTVRGEVIFGDFARRMCGWRDGDTVAVVPPSVKSIPPFAFADCKSLRRVEFQGMQLREIGDYAFLGCVDLREMTVPNGVVEIGQGCFKGCSGLRRLSLPRGVRKIPHALCAGCASLREVSLPSTLHDIGSHAFAYCSSLDGIKLPDGVSHIGSNVFSYCTSLREADVPDSVTELESYAFSECVALERVKLPGNPSLLGELLLSGCVSVREIVEPSVTPPAFDCSSTLFEPELGWIYKVCRLRVPEESREAYASASGWNLFF